MKLTILGSGTSIGVPVKGCPCAVCNSSSPHDKRLRTSALVKTDDGMNILMDCGPDFREQCLRLPTFEQIHGVLITHEHYDHVGGLDDLRPYSVFGDIPLYCQSDVARALRVRMPYALVDHVYPGRPRIYLEEIVAGKPFLIGKTEIKPIRVMHGQLPILGYVIGGKLGYVTDMLTMPDASFKALQGVDTLIINALRPREHPTHQNIEQAIETARRVGARQTYFVHMSHSIGLHDEACAKLPAGITFAYDQMEIEL